MKTCLLFAVLLTAVASFAAKDIVMFVGAHPDDVENCMGLALRMKDDYDVRVVDMTRGEGGCGKEGWQDGTTAVKRVAEKALFRSWGKGDWLFEQSCELLALLAYLFEVIPCAECRLHCLWAMARHRMLTKAILEECRYDCNEDVREYVSRVRSRSETAE